MSVTIYMATPWYFQTDRSNCKPLLKILPQPIQLIERIFNTASTKTRKILSIIMKWKAELIKAPFAKNGRHQKSEISERIIVLAIFASLKNIKRDFQIQEILVNLLLDKPKRNLIWYLHISMSIAIGVLQRNLSFVKELLFLTKEMKKVNRNVLQY